MFRILLFAALFISQFAAADAYKCAKMVVKDGFFTKYEYLGNTWGANTKKHGVVSSSIGSSVEKTTSSIDPGVLTGNLVSTAQYFSSWGECSMVDYHITRQMREEFIDQNLVEIKRQVAIGEGYHVESLAMVSGCFGVDKSAWAKRLQSHTASLYDAQSGAEFASYLDLVIQANGELTQHCAVL